MGRRTWCSQECIDAFKSENDWQHLRWRLELRDKGVCVFCGFDARKMERILNHVKKDGWHFHREIIEWLVGLGFDRGISLWQADHVVPRVLGGKNELSNLRTLCVPCHKLAAARLASERATARHDVTRPLFHEVIDDIEKAGR